MTHYLKTLTAYFNSVWNGVKTFEVRKNDRNFQPGDSLWLIEWPIVEDHDRYSRFIRAKVTYLTNYGQKENFVVMQIIVEDIGFLPEGDAERLLGCE